jgi:hypothetical protein
MGLLRHFGLKLPDSLVPFLAAQEGGVASVTDLEQDMRDILQNWRDAASDGAALFATDKLSKRIDDLESGSWTSFVASLVGNIVWAGAVFASGGAVAVFAVSLAGIAIAAAPGVPVESKSLVGEVQKGMQNLVYALHGKLDGSLRGKATSLIKSIPGIGRYRALARFVEASFAPGYFSIDASYATIPTLNLEGIRNLYVERAEAELDRYVAAQRAFEKKMEAELAAKRAAEWARREKQDHDDAFPPPTYGPIPGKKFQR